MKQKVRGGIRKGAGRKPVLNKKKQISLYVESAKILKFGNEEKLKERVYKFIEEYNSDELNSKISYTPTTSQSYDAPRLNNLTHDEPAQWEEPKIKLVRSYHNYLELKKACDTPEEWAELEAEILSAGNLTRKEKDFLTKPH